MSAAISSATSREHFDLLMFLEGNGNRFAGRAIAREYASGASVDASRRAREFELSPDNRTSLLRTYVPSGPERILAQARASEASTKPNGRGSCIHENSAECGKPAVASVCAVLLAGGRGTRFWPRSRMRTPKQLLNIAGQANDVARNGRASRAACARAKYLGGDERRAGRRRAARIAAACRPRTVLAEPMGRNTAAAIGLAAIHLAHEHGDALMAVLPSDSYIADAARYRSAVARALRSRSHSRKSRRPGHPANAARDGLRIHRARRRALAHARHRRLRGAALHGKTGDSELAEKYVASGKYFWNAGMFFWRVSTFLENLQRFLPATHEALMRTGSDASARGDTRRTLRRMYPHLENISVDYAIMEPATRRARRGHAFWLFPQTSAGAILARGPPSMNCWRRSREPMYRRARLLRSTRKEIISGVRRNLWRPLACMTLCWLKPRTPCCLCSRDRSQDVGKIVKWLEEQKRERNLISLREGFTRLEL